MGAGIWSQKQQIWTIAAQPAPAAWEYGMQSTSQFLNGFSSFGMIEMLESS